MDSNPVRTVSVPPATSWVAPAQTPRVLTSAFSRSPDPPPASGGSSKEKRPSSALQLAPAPQETGELPPHSTPAPRAPREPSPPLSPRSTTPARVSIRITPASAPGPYLADYAPGSTVTDSMAPA